jgi:hypothetical protein
VTFSSSAATFAQSGATYSITKSTIAAGGGMSTSATYAVTGTAGQHDAGDPTGATYKLLGGFWTPAPGGSTTTPDPLTPDPSGLGKNRFVSFAAPTPPAAAGGSQTAIRVTLTTLYDGPGCPARGGTLPDLSAFETQVRWLGPPGAYPAEVVPAEPDIIVAGLQCDPHFRDWSAAGLASEFPGAGTSLIHAYGAEVFPCSTYELEVVDISCPDLDSPSCYSAGLTANTAPWGDLVAPYDLVSFLDIGATVNCYKSTPIAGGQNKVRCLLWNNVLNPSQKVNFLDIGAVVNAYKTIPYSQLGPANCP